MILFPEKINGRFARLERPVFEDGSVPSIWINYSDNLFDWGKPKLLIAPEREWEAAKIGGSTPPLLTEAGWLVIYHGVSSRDREYRVGALLLDAADPEKRLSRGLRILSWNRNTVRERRVLQRLRFPDRQRHRRRHRYVYYGGADRYCCAATCSVSELIKFLLSEGKE